ncbi:MAG: VOC family protein [Phyllobacterium sp.]
MDISPLNNPRPVDHLVLPTGDLAGARVRLNALGFTVAPEGKHPFGTENVCVYMGDNTFLEMLAIGQRETCEEAARQGNVFVARDLAYRFRNGDEGFSALVMGTNDAQDDHKQFWAAGLSAGKVLDFSRPFVDADGQQGKASFRLAFAADLRAPDSFYFTCQKINVPQGDRSALETHRNGVMSIRAVVLSETNPTDFQYLLQEVTRQRDTQAHSFGLDIETANARVNVLTATGMQAFFGMTVREEDRGLRLRAVVYAVRDMNALRNLLNKNAVLFDEIGERIVVQPTIGQGAAFAFEAR